MFKSLSLHNWRQFREVSFEFHERLTILTGANGAGKTTILSLLNRHFGWDINFVATPTFGSRTGRMRFRSGTYDPRFPSEFDDYEDGTEAADAAKARRPIGELEYWDGQRAELAVADEVEQIFSVRIQGQQQMAGIFIASHRPIFVYSPVTTIPTTVQSREELLNRYVNELRQRFTPKSRVVSPSFHLKEALISLATFGYGNEVVIANSGSRDLFEGFQAILRMVLPPSLGFQRFEIRMPEIVLICSSGRFPIDAVSGGISAILDIAWQIFLQSRESASFVVIVDEPENHLHPELQRTLLPSLLDAFPQAQFVVSTHNPFIVSAVPSSNVIVLRFVDGHVVSEVLDFVNKAGSSNDILQDALGLSNALPLWVERRLGEITSKYGAQPLTEQSLSQMREELAELGMADFLPESLSRLLDFRT